VGILPNNRDVYRTFEEVYRWDKIGPARANSCFYQFIRGRVNKQKSLYFADDRIQVNVINGRSHRQWESVNCEEGFRQDVQN